MKHISILLLLVIMLSGCAVNKQLLTLDCTYQEAIVAGKVHVYYNGKEVTSDCKIAFNEPYYKPTPYVLNHDGIFVHKLIKGVNSLRQVHYKNLTFNIPAGVVSFTIAENKTLNYVGDLTVNWVDNTGNPGGMVAAGFFLGGIAGGAVLGGIGVLADKGGQAEVYSENNLAEMQEYLKFCYDSNQVINDLTIPLTHPDDYTNHQLFIHPSHNPKYLEFVVKNRDSVHGKLRYLKKKKIYILSDDKIYVIPKKKLVAIKDKTGEEISLESLDNQYFEIINFNKYEVITL